MDYMKQLGIVIREARKQKRFSKNGFHYRTRISYQAITKIEQGKVYPNLETVLTICQALEMKPSELFALAENR